MSSIVNSNEGRADWNQFASASGQRSLPAIVSELAQRFHALRSRYARWLLLIVAASGLAAVVGVWLLLAMSDYWFELPLRLRQWVAALTCALTLVTAAWTGWWIANQASARQFATRMENRFESMGQRLRTVLDLESGKLRAPDAMLAALGHQTMARWETVQPSLMLPRRAMLLSCLACACMLAGLGSWCVGSPEARTALLRAAGWDRPYTTMHVTPGDSLLLEGLRPEVQLELRGRPNRHVALRYRRAADSDWMETDLKADLDTTKNRPNAQQASLVFASKLDKLTSDMQYQFATDVGQSPVYTIKMQPKLVVLESNATVAPPAYTQLPERTFNTEEVTVLVGSRVTISLRVNRPLITARLMVGPNAKQLEEVALSREGDGSMWKFSLPSDRALQWQFSGFGKDNAPLPAVHGKLRIRQDESPHLDWQSPADELTVNMLAEVPMSVMISDDYGLTHAGIVFLLGESEEFVLKEWALDDSETTKDPSGKRQITTRIRLDEVLPLESFQLSERDFVSYYAFAEDNREGNVQHADSEVRYLDIRPLKQLISVIEPQGGGRGGRSFPALNEIISRERYLYNRTRVISRHYDANNSDQLRTLERMVETQSELANFTRYLIEFLLSQGNDDNEALGQAESVMLQASDALATADFETAILREQDAIRLLVEAKNNAEIAVSKLINPNQRTQLNNFQRQMLNRLRRQAKPSEAKIADDIKQIAMEQKRIAERVARWRKQPQANAASVSDSPSPIETTQVPADKTSADNPAADKPAADEAAADKVAADNPATGEPATETPQLSVEDQLKADQQELLDRMTTLQSELSEKIKESTLASQRLADGLAHLDALTGSSAKGEWDSFPATGFALSAELMELGEHVKSLAESEPARRIASLRDLTASLADKEVELANQVEQIEQSPIESKTREQRIDAMGPRAKWIDGRALTIDDVLKLPMNVGDLRASDIVDQLEKLVTQQDFRSRLQATRQSAREFLDNHPVENWRDATRDRARELAHMAELLDQLQRQLVAPRVEQLRRMENKATQLVNALSAGTNNSNVNAQSGQNGVGAAQASVNSNGGGAGKTKAEEDEQGIRQLQSQLQSDLQSAGLAELAELLDGAANNQDNQPENDQSGSAGNDRSGSGRAMAGGAASQFGYQRLVRGHRNAILVRQKLQAMLQELVLLETTIDRTAPVPAQYRELVDVYYKSLAGEQ